MYNSILSYLNSQVSSTLVEQRVYEAIFLTAASPEFAVQR